MVMTRLVINLLRYAKVCVCVWGGGINTDYYCILHFF